MRKLPLRARQRGKSSLRLVVDTNVIVSGLLNRLGKPGRIVNSILDGTIQVIYSTGILQEYRDVLVRPKFQFQPQEITALLDVVAHNRELIAFVPPMPSIRFPDPPDSVFFLVAAAARCPLVTGNLKHFPKNSGVDLLSPADLHGRMTSPR